MNQFIPQGPGPPQRPHIPAGAGELFPSELATANTLKVREVCFEPHSGQFTLSAPDIVFTSCSKCFLQDLHVYS
jgi:hypothetical protein